ncbi:MAG: hypothetical protein V8R80_09605 [Eubacterium sp.]
MTPQWQEIKEQLFGELDMTQDIPDEELWQRIENGVSRFACSRTRRPWNRGRRMAGRSLIPFESWTFCRELLDDPEDHGNYGEWKQGDFL